MSYFAIQQKFANYCKSTILKKKKSVSTSGNVYQIFQRILLLCYNKILDILRYIEMCKDQKQNRQFLNAKRCVCVCIHIYIYIKLKI